MIIVACSSREQVGKKMYSGFWSKCCLEYECLACGETLIRRPELQPKLSIDTALCGDLILG